MKRCLIAILLSTLVVPAVAQATPRTGKWNTRPTSSTTMSIGTIGQSPTFPTGLFARTYTRKGATCVDTTKPGQKTVRFLREELSGIPIKRVGRSYTVNYRHPSYHAKDRSETLTTLKGKFARRDTILPLTVHMSWKLGTSSCSTDYSTTLRRSFR